jgi:hypothetical protein
MGLNTYPKRGEIYLVNLDPTVGAEINKTRPALIISNDINNQFPDTVTVIPITSYVERSNKGTFKNEIAFPAISALHKFTAYLLSIHKLNHIIPDFRLV